jgi:enamine deaminase RidA (YjgF/YER057c/UK114 family)
MRGRREGADRRQSVDCSEAIRECAGCEERSSRSRVSALSRRAKQNRENNMTIQRFETGPRMSQVVINGNTVYLAGVVANNAPGKSVTEQTQDVLKTIDGHLARAGTDKSKLLSATIYITDMKTFQEMNAVWDAWVSPGNTPARATVEAKLASPQYNVEIMVVAAK